MQMVHSDYILARYFLNHTFLEQAFDQLCDAGFRSEHGRFMKIHGKISNQWNYLVSISSMVGCCGSGTSAPTLATDLKPGQVHINVQGCWAKQCGLTTVLNMSRRCNKGASNFTKVLRMTFCLLFVILGVNIFKSLQRAKCIFDSKFNSAVILLCR